VLKISESDLVFTTDLPVAAGMNLRFTTPVPFFIHVLPSKEQSKTPTYYGLIHSIGEVQKKELRRFINGLFFRDHDAQQASEVEEFQKLNEAKLQEKLEALKASVEGEAEKKASTEEGS
jgi:hypothetical protein